MKIKSSLLNPIYEEENRTEIFSALIDNIKDGMTFVLDEGKVAAFDSFLLFSDTYPTMTITLHTRSVPFWVEFDGDEPMLLENCPVSFFRTLLMNISRGNYTTSAE